VIAGVVALTGGKACRLAARRHNITIVVEILEAPEARKAYSSSSQMKRRSKTMKASLRVALAMSGAAALLTVPAAAKSLHHRPGAVPAVGAAGDAYGSVRTRRAYRWGPYAVYPMYPAYPAYPMYRAYGTPGEGGPYTPSRPVQAWGRYNDFQDNKRW
jgi:hypothetical protein